MRFLILAILMASCDTQLGRWETLQVAPDVPRYAERYKAWTKEVFLFFDSDEMAKPTPSWVPGKAVGEYQILRVDGGPPQLADGRPVETLRVIRILEPGWTFPLVK